MGNKLNYGKRFRTGAASIGYRYDEHLHKGMVPAFVRHLTPEQKALGLRKSHATIHARRTPVTLAGNVQPAFVDEHLAAQERMVERIRRATELLAFGITDINESVKDSDGADGMIGLDIVIDAINKLCTMARIKVPDLPERKPGAVPKALCINCGAWCARKSGGMCERCNEEKEERRAARDTRIRQAQQERLRMAEKEMAALAKLARLVDERRRRHHDRTERYGRDTCEDAMVVEDGRRSEYAACGGAAAHRHSEDHSRIAEGGDRSGPPGFRDSSGAYR